MQVSEEVDATAVGLVGGGSRWARRRSEDGVLVVSTARLTAALRESAGPETRRSWRPWRVR